MALFALAARTTMPMRVRSMTKKRASDSSSQKPMMNSR
jgi:hypothetical protein